VVASDVGVWGLKQVELYDDRYRLIDDAAEAEGDTVEHKPSECDESTKVFGDDMLGRLADFSLEGLAECG